MDNQSNPPTDPPPDQFQNLPVRTYRISSLSRKKRKKLRIQLNTELQRVKAMIKTTNIKAAKMKKAKIKAVKIKTSKTESGSHQFQNVLPQNLARLIDQCNDGILKRLRKYPNCKHLNEPVSVKGLAPGEAIGLNEIANRFKEKSYKSPFQFADDMRSACNHAINYDKRDEVVKVASLVLDKFNELIEPILVYWKRLGGVVDEEIWKESMDVEAVLGEKSGNTLVSIPQFLDKVNELVEPVLVDWKRFGGVVDEEIWKESTDVEAGLGEKSDWKRLGGVVDEEIWKESTDVEAGLGEKSGESGENGVSDSERGDDAGCIDFNASDSGNDEDDALG